MLGLIILIIAAVIVIIMLSVIIGDDFISGMWMVKHPVLFVQGLTISIGSLLIFTIICFGGIYGCLKFEETRDTYIRFCVKTMDAPVAYCEDKFKDIVYELELRNKYNID